MAKAKSKRYDEGGVTEGQNANIDDDTRARAMRYVQEQSEKGSEDESSGEKTVSRSTKAKVSTKPAESKSRGASVDDEAGTTRGRPAEGEPKMTKGERPMVTLNGIPTRRLKENETVADVAAAAERRSREPVGPNSASGSELGRNVKNTLSALAPLGGGVGKIGAEIALSGRAAKTAEAAAEAKKTADAAAKATRAARVAKTAPRAEREAKTLNPNAWMAGPKGMKENFKSGGGVKGWGIARGSRKAKTY